MKNLLRYAVVLLALLSPVALSAQNEGYDVFKPIARYFSEGDVSHLGAWMDDNLELSLPTRTINCSKNQASKSLGSFFESNTPHSFSIIHQVSKSNMKYCLGQLKAGSETFEVTIFLVMRNEKFRIQQIKIDRRAQSF